MVRCVNCRKMDIQTRFCEGYDKTIKGPDVYKQLKCDKYEQRRLSP